MKDVFNFAGGALKAVGGPVMTAFGFAACIGSQTVYSIMSGQSDNMASSSTDVMDSGIEMTVEGFKQMGSAARSIASRTFGS